MPYFSPETVEGQLHEARNLYPFSPDIPTAIFAFDVEMWEANHDVILELGVACVSNMCECDHYMYIEHTIMIDAGGRRNGRYVEDRMDDFFFGDSQFGHAGCSFNAFQDMVKEARRGRLPCGCGVHPRFRPCRVAVVGHGMRGDMQVLDRFRCFFPHDTIILDTQLIAWGLKHEWGEGGGRMKLSKILDWMEIDVHEDRGLHNAGNDAWYTMEAFMSLCREVAPHNNYGYQNEYYDPDSEYW